MTICKRNEKSMRRRCQRQFCSQSCRRRSRCVFENSLICYSVSCLMGFRCLKFFVQIHISFCMSLCQQIYGYYPLTYTRWTERATYLIRSWMSPPLLTSYRSLFSFVNLLAKITSWALWRARNFELYENLEKNQYTSIFLDFEAFWFEIFLNI